MLIQTEHITGGACFHHSDQLGQQHDNTHAESQAEFLKHLRDVHTLHITWDREVVQIVLIPYINSPTPGR